MPKQTADLPQQDDGDPVTNDLHILVGRNMRTARIALGCNQQDFAEKAGFTQQYISLVEKGQTNLSLGNLRRIAAALNQDAASLLKPSDSGAPDTESAG